VACSAIKNIIAAGPAILVMSGILAISIVLVPFSGFARLGRLGLSWQLCHTDAKATVEHQHFAPSDQPLADEQIDRLVDQALQRNHFANAEFGNLLPWQLNPTQLDAHISVAPRGRHSINHAVYPG